MMGQKLYAQRPDAGQLPNASVQGNAPYRNGVSMDLYTGINNVNIPIYDYSIDGLDLGVSVSYNTQGIKVDQTASSVGLGWSLNANSYITREVHGIEDEMTFRALYDGTTFQRPSIRGSLVTKPNPLPSYMQKETYPDGTTDQNDVFTAVLAGRPIQFTIEKSSTGNGIQIWTSPKTEIQVKLFVDGNIVSNYASLDTSVAKDMNSHVLTFMITDEHGNRWYFDRGDYTRNNYKFPGINDWFMYNSVNTWRVNSIVTYTGATIKYYYNEIYLDYPYYKNCQVRETYTHGSYGGFNSTIQNQANPTYNPPSGGISMDTSIQDWTGYVSHVNRIEYPNGTIVSFNMETDPSKQRCDLMADAYALKSVSITNKLDNTISNSFKYNFNYYYSHSPRPELQDETLPYGYNCNSITVAYGGDDAYLQMYERVRLCLKSITKVGFDGQTTEPYYSFEYNTTPLPPRFSPAQDFYGYYNNAACAPLTYTKNGSSYSLPNIPVSYHSVSIQTADGTNFSGSYGVDKTPNLTYAQAGVLTKVINATGGSQTFHYTTTSLTNPTPIDYPNFSNPEGDNAFDGLVTDVITTKDGYNNSNDVRTEYTYSNGERFFKSQHTWYPSNLTNYPSDIGSTPHIYEKIYTNQFVAPQNYLRGSNHGYQNVTESTYGFANEFLGKKEYTFSGVMNVETSGLGNVQSLLPLWSTGQYEVDLFYYTAPFSIRKGEMGLLKEQKSYDNTNTLINDIVNSYQNDGGWLATAPANFLPTWRTYNSQTQSDEVYQTLPQWMPTPRPYHHFFNNSDNLIQSIETKYSPTGSVQNTYSFSYDGNDNLVTTTGTDSKGLQATTQNLYGNFQFLTGQENRRVLPDGNTYIVGRSESNIPWLHSGPNDLRTLKTKNPIDATVPYSYLQSLITIDKHYTFDDNTNVVETSYDGGKKFSAAIWDSRIGQKVASVNNAHFDQIAYTSFEGQVAASGVQDENKGNWEYDPAKIVYGASANPPLTGRCYYNLGTSSIYSANQLQNGQKYIVTVWANAAPKYYLNGQWVSFPTSSVTSTGTWGTWALYTATITGDGNPLILTSSSSLTRIDELRMYPFGASMSTATYEPLIGISSQCDAHNNILFFEYDAMGRQTTVRDIDKNIINYTKTVVQGSDF